MNINIFDSSSHEGMDIMGAKLVILTEIHSEPEVTQLILRELNLTSSD